MGGMRFLAHPYLDNALIFASTLRLYQRQDPRLCVKMPTGAECLEEAMAIAREVGMTDMEIEEAIRGDR